jgi:hypothetical protein
MKEILQTLMIAGGGLGALVSTPVALHLYFAKGAIDGSLNTADQFSLLSPLICLALLGCGIIWIRRQKRLSQNGMNRRLLGDGDGADGGGGDGE